MIGSNNRRIAFLPESDGNLYISRMQNLLSNFGKIERPLSIRKAVLTFFTTMRKPYDILWFNFTDNQIVDSNGDISLKKAIKLFVRTALMAKLSNTAIFVRHNHFPHATKHKYSARAKAIIDAYEKLFDKVVTLSGSEARGNKLYCPHPLYQVIENSNEAFDVNTLQLPPEYYVVFGRIVPYKKIEELVNVFPRNKTLLVAGSVGDEDYAKRLSEIKKENFIFMPGRLSEAQAQAIVSGSQAVVISHADKDMIVSGTFFYAMTLRKPVYAVETDFFKWIQSRLSAGYLYLSQDLDTLAKTIENASIQNNLLPAEPINREFGDETVLVALRNILS